MTATERTAIADYLTTFNAANKLVKLDGSNKIPVTHIPSLSYLPLTGGALTGALSGTNITLSGNLTVGGISYINGTIASDNEGINFSVEYLNFMGEDGAWISNVRTPVHGHQAVNKEYVDNLVVANFTTRDPVKAASTANVAPLVALNSLDGYALAAGDRVLLKNQTNPAQNGVYLLNAGKVPVKVEEDSKKGSAVFVENGNTNNDYIFHCSDTNTWKAFSKPDTTKAGSGLQKVGTTLSIVNGGVTNDMLAGSIAVSKLANFTAAQIMNATRDYIRALILRICSK